MRYEQRQYAQLPSLVLKRKEFSQPSPSASFCFLEKEYMAKAGTAIWDPNMEGMYLRQQRNLVSEDCRAARPAPSF